MRSNFKNQGEMILMYWPSDKDGTVILEAAHSIKVFETISDFMEAETGYSDCTRFVRFNLGTLEREDVTEDVAQAWINANEVLDNSGEPVSCPPFVDEVRFDELVGDALADLNSWRKGPQHHFGCPARI